MRGKQITNRLLAAVTAILLFAGLFSFSGLMTKAYADDSCIRWGDKSYSSLNDAAKDMKDGDTVVLEVYGKIRGDQEIKDKKVSLTIKAGSDSSQAVFTGKVKLSGLNSLSLSGDGTSLYFEDTVDVRSIDAVDLVNVMINKSLVDTPYEKTALSMHKVKGSINICAFSGNVTISDSAMDQITSTSFIYPESLSKIARDDYLASAKSRPALELENTTLNLLKNCGVVNEEDEYHCRGLNLESRSRIDRVEDCDISAYYAGIYLKYYCVIDTIKNCRIKSRRNALEFEEQTFGESQIKNLTGQTVIDGYIRYGCDRGAVMTVEKGLKKAYGDVVLRNYVSDAKDIKKIDKPEGYEWYRNSDGGFCLRSTECSVVYNSNDSEGNMSGEKIEKAKGGDSFTLADNKFTLDGYTFKGWSEDRTGEGKIYQPGDKLKFDGQAKRVFYAIWEGSDRHKIEFNSDGGSDVPFQYVVDGNPAKKPDDPTKEGSDFDGWYTDKELTEKYDFSDPVTEDAVLYAKWKHYELTATLGPSWSARDIMKETTLDPVFFKHGTVPDLPTDPGVPGYVIVRWTLDPYGFTPYNNEPLKKDTNLYAVLEEVIYKVTVVPNGGNFNSSKGWNSSTTTFEYHYNDSFDAIWSVRNNGHSFEGYYADPELTQKIDLPEKVTSDMTIYLSWKPVSYKVRYFDEDKKTLLYEEKVLYQSRLTFRPEKAHKKFVAWQWQRYSRPELGMSTWNMDADTISRDMTFIAKWEDDGTEHAWSEWEVIKEATKDSPGMEERTCEACGAKETREIISGETQEQIDDPAVAPLEHVERVNPTCTDEGSIEYWILKGDSEQSTHYYADSEGIEELNKEDLVLEPWGHAYEFIDDDFDAPEENYDTASRSKYPTCTEEGWLAFKCTECGDFYKTEPYKMREDGKHGEKTGVDPDHPDEPFAIEVDPTCDEDGTRYQVWFCSVCGEMIDLSVEHIDALGHDWAEPIYEWAEDNSLVAASVTCKRCGEVQSETVPTTYEITKEPTANEPGEMTYTADFNSDRFTVQERKAELEPTGSAEETGSENEEETEPEKEEKAIEDDE